MRARRWRSWARDRGLGTPGVGIDLAAANQLDLQRTGTTLGQESLPLLEGGADEQEFLGRVAVLAQDTTGDLATADRGLRLGLLGDKHSLAVGILTLNNLVDQGGRRHTRARHQLGAHAVGIHGCRAEGGDRVLVQVGGHRDLGRGGTHRVKLSAHLERLRNQVARVQTHRAQLAARSARGLNRVNDALPDVVGVHEQRRASAQLGDLGIEGVALSVVQERERVGGRADATDPVALGRLEVGGTLEATDDGGAGAETAARCVGGGAHHVHAGATMGRDCHARGCRGHRAVVVENRQEQRLQERAVREGALNGEQGRTGEIALALGVAQMSPEKRHVVRNWAASSEMIPWSRSQSICSASNSKRSRASRIRPVPATTPKRRVQAGGARTAQTCSDDVRCRP